MFHSFHLLKMMFHYNIMLEGNSQLTKGQNTQRRIIWVAWQTIVWRGIFSNKGKILVSCWHAVCHRNNVNLSTVVVSPSKFQSLSRSLPPNPSLFFWNYSYFVGENGTAWSVWLFLAKVKNIFPAVFMFMLARTLLVNKYMYLELSFNYFVVFI